MTSSRTASCSTSRHSHDDDDDDGDIDHSSRTWTKLFSRRDDRAGLHVCDPQVYLLGLELGRRCGVGADV